MRAQESSYVYNQFSVLLTPMSLQDLSSTFFLLLFATFSVSVYYSPPDQKPNDVEWKGNRRAIVLDDEDPYGKMANLSWSRGWMCGWTPHGLCFTPDRKKDIHNFYVIPFPHIKTHVYCDQRPNLNSGWGFALNSVILAKFSRANKGELWRGLVRRYTQNGHGTVLKLTAKTFFTSLGVNQIQETFYPGQVYLEGAHDACRFFKTECLPSEYCLPRVLSGIIWPGEYKCICKNGWRKVRGRGCVDIDECDVKHSPCRWWAVCANTLGSYSCHCRTGYKGEKCHVDIDECQMKPCPDNSVCQNIPGSFNCTCQPGFSGKGCSEYLGMDSSPRNDAIITFQVVKQHSVKEISIPRKKPVTVIRKAVHTIDPGYKEKVIMGSLIATLNLLGLFLYWRQRKKKANKELENERVIPTSQDLAREETNSSFGVWGEEETLPTSHMLVHKETISTSSILNEETVAENMLLENTTLTSSNSLTNKGRILSRDLIVNTGDIFNSDETIRGKETTITRQTLDKKDYLDFETLENKEDLQVDSTEIKETISSNHELVNKETTGYTQILENNST